MGIVFTPLYVHYLGIEAYGLIGVFTMLQTWLFLLDMGITPTLSREMARFDAGAYDSQKIRNFVRSLEIIYIFIAITVLIGLLLVSDWITINWLQIETLNASVVANALSLSGVFIVLRWFSGLYRGAIMGLQQQVWLNYTSALFATVRGLGAVGVLAWISPTVFAFLIFQSVLAAIEAIVLAVKMHFLLPKSDKPSYFSIDSLQHVWKFAAGMSANSLQALLLTQVDKLLLSKLLPIAEFGYYNLAITLAGGLYILMGAITNAAYPQFVLLIERGDSQTLIKTYHKLSQMLSMVVAPTAIVLAFYSENVLLLWMNNESTAKAVAPLVSLLVVGYLLNGMLQIPYFLQLAYGWTKLNLTTNFISILILVPAVYITVPIYGVKATPIIWIILNIVYIVVTIPIMHSRLLPNEMWSWYQKDIVLPLLSIFAAISALYYVMPVPSINQPIVNIIDILLAAILGIIVAFLVTPLGRNLLKRNIHIKSLKFR